MKLLHDKDLNTLIVKQKTLVKNIDYSGDWYDRNSPIQATSVDLHIGDIHIPGVNENESGSLNKPIDQHILQPGHTAVIVTHEDLDMPSDIAALGFPPSRVSFKGILMTNPGHIDPGYKGPMHFTVINMGRTSYVLRRKDVIVTLLFFKLGAAVNNDWSSRYKHGEECPLTQANLDRLCQDFADVSNRATSIAKKIVGDAELSIKQREISIKKWSWLAPVLAAGVTGLILYIGSILGSPWKDEIREVEIQIEELETRLDAEEIGERMEIIEKQLNKLQQSLE